jgi:hypothetical protein
MYRLHLHSTPIQAIDTGDNLLYLQVSIGSEDGLVAQGVLVILIDGEVGGEAFVEEGVAVLEDDLDGVFGMGT